MSTVSTDQLVGQNIGRYVVKSLLGQARLSAVYLVQHPEQDAPAALTTFLVPTRFSTEARVRFNQRFQREAATVAALSHPNILPILDYGEQYDYPYLVTPYLVNGSLANIIKQRGRCTPNYALAVLKQAADGLGYAHARDIVHGTLKPANILVADDQHFLVAGFGLAHMLQMRGIEQNSQPYSYLLSVADTFLYASTSIAPEVVQGQPVDARADIYALGIMLFELLHGAPPFTGETPLDIALQHVQRPIPSLHALHPEIPIAMELVINHALVLNPAQRFQHVSDLLEAFEQVCRGSMSSLPVVKSSATHLSHYAQLARDVQNVPDEEVSTGSWQLTPPIVTGKFLTPGTTARTRSGKTTARIDAVQPDDKADGWQILPPIITKHTPAVLSAPAVPEVQASVQQVTEAPEEHFTRLEQNAPTPSLIPETSLEKVDTMTTPEWWIQAPSVIPTSSEATQQTLDQPKKTSLGREKQTPATEINRLLPVERMHNDPRRRRLIATLAAGGVAVVGVVVFGLKHFETTSSQVPHNTSSTPQPSNNIHSTPTAPPKETPVKTAPSKAGTVLLSSPLGVNTSAAIVNPTDGQAGLLIHLTNGNFVAYERACTHEGTPVNYDPLTHTLVCPAHGAVFDPVNNAKVLQGPANRPLPPIAIKVNADGTISSA